jgi:hypothetical protein
MRSPLSLLIVTLALSLSALGADDAWKPLFNGKDLTGWVQQGGKARYEVVDGTIVGTSVPNTENSFLCTGKEYENFILELEFKVDDGLNSGVQIRSRAAEKEYSEDWNGKTVKFKAGRVHGLQVEIDPSKRAWTGGVHGEGGIGWLNDLKNNEPARNAFKAGDWNKLRIEARGDSIKTWLNGVPAADLKNGVIKTGFIGLQVHGVGNNEKAMSVRFREIRIQELPPSH